MPESSPKHRYSIVACARWEETQIQEWVEYHKSIGFSHIYLYSNDDDPTPLFRAVAPYTYGADPFVTFQYWPKIGEQVEIYLHFLRTFKHETEWFGFLDIDEFFVLPGINNIATFMRDYEANVDCLYFNWVVYGHCGRVRREDVPTLTSYTRRASQPDAHTKFVCRAACVEEDAVRQGYQAGCGSFYHFLDNYQLPNLRCADVLHGSTQGYGAEFPTSAIPFATREGFAEAVLQRGYIAHFQFRSEEDFLRRWRRGGYPNGEQWRAMYETGVHKAILANNNAVYDTYLAAYWHRYTAPAMQFGRRNPYFPLPYENVALNKPSWQSSVFEPGELKEPASSRVSGGGNNGIRTGIYGFHTQHDLRPWWIVDLLTAHRIVEVHIYNRRDAPAIAARANELDVLGSLDGGSWITLLTHTGPDPFGLDGSPLVIFGAPAAAFRFVMLRLRSAGYLHLDEVEIYGYPVQASSDVVGPVTGND
jgi:Glycosyl transferase family 2/F5/8 type C domain